MEDNGLFYLTKDTNPALYADIYRQTHKLADKARRECPDMWKDEISRHAQLYTSGILQAYGAMEPVIYHNIRGMAGSIVGLLPETGLEAEVRRIERLEGPYVDSSGFSDYIDAAMFWHGFNRNGGTVMHGIDLHKVSSFFNIILNFNINISILYL